MTTLGNRARKRREQLGFSLPELANRIRDTFGIKVSWQALQQVELGDSAGTKYLVPLARALGVTSDWLFDESGTPAQTSAEALLVGKVGAGAEIVRFDHPDILGGIPLPPGLDAPNAAEIEGYSQYPLLPRWIIFYGPENRGIPERCVGKFCVVQVKDGPILLKFLKRGSKKGLWRLESSNEPAREDVKLLWAAMVMDIRPR